ncbi:MAG: hypothetical protein C0390_03760 [Syntrophus sp. (in: bacteria)]|nr:hypothetical protein [Syntrophus sp. (in: bacteria)]
MKKTTGALIALIISVQLFSLPLLVSEARAETRITITFAAGGVACGVYFFLQFAFRSSMTIQQFQDNTALVNHGPEGWQIAPPTLNVIRDGRRNKLSLTDSPDTLQMNLFQFRF